MRNTGIAVIILAGLLICSATSVSAAKVRACVSIPPQKAFVTAVGRDLVQTRVMVRPGANPATYEPKPSQLADLAHTDVYFTVGVPFERAWLDRFTAVNPGLRIVRTEQGIDKIALPSTYSFSLSSTDPKDHDRHTGIKDPHIWLSPPLVARQARTISQALRKIDPDHARQYQENLTAFQSRIQELDTELHSILQPVQGRSFLTFHPAWGYFTRRYGLRQVAVELEGKEPKPSQLAELISFARDRNIRAIFVQPQFSSKSAEMVAREIGATVVIADPLAADWESNLRRQARQIRRLLAPGPEQK